MTTEQIDKCDEMLPPVGEARPATAAGPFGRVVGRAQDVVPLLEPKSVALVVTDPPWELSRNGGGGGRFEECASYPLLTIEEIARTLGALRKKMVSGGHLYTWAPAGAELGVIIPLVEQQDFHLIRVLAWDRGVHRGLGAYRNAWEPVLIFGNGARARPFNFAGKFASLLKARSPEYRTAKPWQLYKVFLEMSSRPGELVVDPFCGLNPLERAASIVQPSRRWLAVDILTPEAIRGEVAGRTRRRHNGGLLANRAPDPRWNPPPSGIPQSKLEVAG